MEFPACAAIATVSMGNGKHAVGLEGSVMDEGEGTGGWGGAGEKGLLLGKARAVKKEVTKQ